MDLGKGRNQPVTTFSTEKLNKILLLAGMLTKQLQIRRAEERLSTEIILAHFLLI